MNSVCYHFRPEIAAQIKENADRLVAKRRFGLLTSHEVRFLQAAFVAKLMSADGARDESDPQRNVAAKCPDCERVHVMNADVLRFVCPCMPHLHRVAAACRTELTGRQRLVLGSHGGPSS
jgi:hypothetical protein